MQGLLSLCEQGLIICNVKPGINIILYRNDVISCLVNSLNVSVFIDFRKLKIISSIEVRNDLYKSLIVSAVVVII